MQRARAAPESMSWAAQPSPEMAHPVWRRSGIRPIAERELGGVGMGTAVSVFCTDASTMTAVPAQDALLRH